MFIAVRDSRKNQDGKHLPVDQEKGAQCPSQGSYPLPCTCVKRSPTKKLPISYGVTIIIVPTNLVGKWLKEFQMHTLTREEGGMEWDITSAYKKMEGHKAFDQNDQPQDFVFLGKPGQQYLPSNANRRIIITTPGCYQTRFNDFLINAQGKRGLARIVIDEAHTYSTKGTGFANSITRTRCCFYMFITGTPFETSPDQMKVWVEQLNWEEWEIALKVMHAYAYHWIAHRGNCTPTAINKLHKTNKALMNKFKKAQNDDKDSEAFLNDKDLQGYIDDVSLFMSTITLRRRRDSIMFGYVVGQSHPSLHTRVKCILQKSDATFIRDLGEKILKKLKKEKKHRVKRTKSQEIQTEVLLDFRKFQLNAHKARVLSSWPPLREIMEIYEEGLTFTLDEVQKCGWLQTDKKTLKDSKVAQLQSTVHTDCPSPYEENIRKLCDEARVPKWRAFRQLEREVWPKESRVVICCYAPVTAIILYWVRHRS